MFDLRCAVWVCRQSQVPDSELVFDGLVLRSIPRIEISELAGYFWNCILTSVSDFADGAHS